MRRISTFIFCTVVMIVIVIVRAVRVFSKRKFYCPVVCPFGDGGPSILLSLHAIPTRLFSQVVSPSLTPTVFYATGRSCRLSPSHLRIHSLYSIYYHLEVTMCGGPSWKREIVPDHKVCSGALCKPMHLMAGCFNSSISSTPPSSLTMAA